jgi:hypothetical protein
MGLWREQIAVPVSHAQSRRLAWNGDIVAEEPSDPAQPEPSAESVRPTRRRSGGLFGRIESFLLPYLGGAQVGPVQGPPEPPRAEWSCDVCHQPASAHSFDSSQRGRMYCPPTGPVVPDVTGSAAGQEPATG